MIDNLLWANLNSHLKGTVNRLHLQNGNYKCVRSLGKDIKEKSVEIGDESPGPTMTTSIHNLHSNNNTQVLKVMIA